MIYLPFKNWNNFTRAWGKFFILFFPPITDEPCYEARGIAENGWGAYVCCPLQIQTKVY